MSLTSRNQHVETDFESDEIRQLDDELCKDEMIAAPDMLENPMKC